MAQFFRKIRQRLLAENKFGKYLVYAAGEIVLVVIGILIALQINNWNQNKIERNREQNYLHEIVRDLEEQSAAFETYLEIENNWYQNGKYILRVFSAGKPLGADEKFYSKLNSLTVRKTFNPIATTFQELVSSGNIGIIQEEHMKRNIIRFYNKMERISKVVENNNSELVDGVCQSVILECTLMINDDYYKELDTINTGLIDPGVLDELKGYSGEIMAGPAMRLRIFNVVEQRTFVALTHVKFYRELKADTEELLALLRTSLGGIDHAAKRPG